tara:strand:- start:721 stop:1476 length:756 start_codon:yes stop_codon:yes gene_type:complete
MRKILVFALFAMSFFAVATFSSDHLTEALNIEAPVDDSKLLFVSDTPLIKKKNPVHRVVNSTVALKFIFSDGAMTVGTGVVADTKEGPVIITAKHVAMTAWPMPLLACSITTFDCENLGSKFVLQTEDPTSSVLGSDWVVYKPKSLPKGIDPITLSKKDVDLGDELWFVGMPYGRGPWISKGNVAWKWKTGSGEMIAATGFAAPGFSGGPVANKHGELIGITVAIVMNPKGEPQVNQILVVPLRNLWILNP